MTGLNLPLPKTFLEKNKLTKHHPERNPTNKDQKCTSLEAASSQLNFYYSQDLLNNMRIQLDQRRESS